ncbi:MAG: DNA replication/repair protein RecF [Pseudomonadota bacterium]
MGLALAPGLGSTYAPQSVAMNSVGTNKVTVERLTVSDFRCYRAAEIAPAGRPVVLTGPNGAGKTNLLEAVSFLAPGRGLRRASLADVARRGASAEGPAPWAVSARLGTITGAVTAGTGLDPSALPGTVRRVVRIDGQTASSQVELGELIVVQWLTPQMDRLFLDGPAGRRRFVDRMVYGMQQGHAAALAAYDQAMRERTKLLKEGRGDDRWLTALEDVMATDGVAVSAARLSAIDRLVRAARVRTDTVFPTADLAVTGTVEAWLADRPAVEAEDALRDLLRERRPIDAAAGAATEGPHRSDVEVRHRAKDMPASQCSTGEQKALLIGLILANARVTEAERGTPPVLLLDEVAAHLDEGRRRALFAELEDLGGQAWLTGTDRSLFEGMAADTLWVGVDDGQLKVEIG